MNKKENFNQKFEQLTKNYQSNFSQKEYEDENNDYDLLMDLFNITPELKRENRQFWGRQLGAYWEKLVIEVFKTYTPDEYKSPFKEGADEPVDLIVGNYAIDTKYRVGSGDAGTLKKFKQYANLIKERGYEPVFLILREDNLPGAITAIKNGGWTFFTGPDSLNFIKENSKFDIEEYLKENKGRYSISRRD